MSSNPILGYWNIRGRGEPIRLLFKYAGVEFQEQQYTYVRGEVQTSDWFKVKSNLGLDFPNLPYLIDGNVKLTQSTAILRYLGRKYKLDGVTEVEKNRIALLEQQLVDLVTFFQQFARFNKNPTEEEKAEFLSKLEAQLELVNKFLRNGKYVAGDNISYVDFWLYENLHGVDGNEVTNGTLSKFVALEQFVQRIEALPQLAIWLKSMQKRERNFIKLNLEFNRIVN